MYGLPYVGLAIAIALLGAGLAWRRHLRESRALLSAYRRAFDEAFRLLQPAPRLEIKHFVYPQFFVTFESARQFDRAKSDGWLDAFTTRIQQLGGQQPGWGKSFRAELAIHFSYEGQFDPLLARWAAEDDLRKKLFKK